MGNVAQQQLKLHKVYKVRYSRKDQENDKICE